MERYRDFMSTRRGSSNWYLEHWKSALGNTSDTTIINFNGKGRAKINKNVLSAFTLLNFCLQEDNYITHRNTTGGYNYRKIANSNMGLWARDNHIWGIYYGMENFYRGELSNPDSVYVLNKIIDNKIGWIYSNEVYMKKLIEFCKPSFLKLNTSKNLYNQTLYKISINEIKSCLKKN